MDLFNSYMGNIQPYDLFGKCYYHNTTLPNLQESPFKLKLDDGLEHESEHEKYMKDLKTRTFSALDYTNFNYRNRPDYHKLK